jgi:hypothetical protein
MWLMLSNAFLSIVAKDCPKDHLLVRARRPGDIEKVFGRRVKIERLTDTDYLFRAAIPREDIKAEICREVARITYPNFKSSVADLDLHDAYMKVWSAMAATQDPPPYSDRQRPVSCPKKKAARKRGATFETPESPT